MAQTPMPRTRSTTEFTGFPKDAFKFFRDLSRNNNRDWFQANKERYEKACKEPMKLLVSALGVDPKDAYLSRINRDLRFARDKSPYHTYIGAGVRDSYIHLSGEGVYVGTGVYMLDPAALDRFRRAIDAASSGKQLERIIGVLRKKGYKVETHDRLSSAPRGYSTDHPRIELLRMKDIFAGKKLPGTTMSGSDATRRIERVMSDGAELGQWLRKHVSPPR